METILPLASRATALTLASGDALAELTVTARLRESMSGVVTSSSTAAVATGSIQTVCQMPDDWV